MTPAIEAARAAGIEHRVIEFACAADRAYGEAAAAALGVRAEVVYKTLIARLDGRRLVVALVPVTCELNLKDLAALAGAKRADMAPAREAERSTGYVIGGISPLGQRRQLPTALDESALGHASVLVSAGRRGLQLELEPADLVRLTAAIVARIARSD
jgi:Cys-tRNA(Pro)/Cys-tRNA(Cys) deacylase